MQRRIITEEIAAFMVRIIEIASGEFYDNDRSMAFRDLNERKIWHHFVEKYEEKRGLKAELIADEIRELLGKEKTPARNAMLLCDNDAEFIRNIIRSLARKYNWNYSVSLDRFYASRACRILSDAKISLSAFTENEMIELFDKERDPGWQTG